MTSTPKSRWFRFHLLTAVLMMVAVGIIIRNNMVGTAGSEEYGLLTSIEYGWPMPFLTAYWKTETGLEISSLGGLSVEKVSYGWSIKGLLTDVWVAATAMIAVALVSEFILRRREGRKP